MENQLEIEQKSKNIVRGERGIERTPGLEHWEKFGHVHDRTRIPVRLARENWKRSL